MKYKCVACRAKHTSAEDHALVLTMTRIDYSVPGDTPQAESCLNK